MSLYERIDYKGYHINVYYDENPLNPRKDFDNLGTLYTAHRRYRPEKDFDKHFDIHKVFDSRIGDFRATFLKQYVTLPVYLYDHGGITISTSPFSCPWDSGFFGIIAVSLEKVREEYGWKHITAGRRKKIESYLKDEIETLDNYYTGEVFGYEITLVSDDDKVVESCWGFFGTEYLETLEHECKRIIDGMCKIAA